MRNFNFFEKLWEHSRTLRRVGLVLVMCLMAIPQVWATHEIYEVYLVYEFNGSSNNWTYYLGDNKDNPVYDLGTLTSNTFKIKEIYWKTRDNWKVSNICAYALYNIGGGETLMGEYTNYYGSADDDAGGCDNHELGNSSVNHTVATANTGNSGLFTFSHFFKATFKNGSEDNWTYCSNNSKNYNFTYKILPPNATAITATPTGAISGSGTELDPYIVPYGGNLTIALSGSNKARADANSSVQYSVDGGSTWGTSSKTFSNVTATSTQNWVFKARCYNSTASLASPDVTEKTVYYKAAKGVTVYKFQTKSSGLGTGNVCAATGTNYSMTTGDGKPLQTLIGGTLTASTSSTSQLKYATNSFQFTGGGGGLLTVKLDNPIKSGDVVRYISNTTSGNTMYLRKTNSSTTTNQLTLDGSNTYDIQTQALPASFAGVTTLCILRNAGTDNISYFEILRPDTLTLNANTGSVSPSALYVARGEATALPHATKANNWHKGWYAASSGGDPVANPYTSTGNRTLYAQYDACSSKTGSLYKFVVKSTLTAGSPFAQATNSTASLNVGNYLSALYGGTLDAYGRNGYLDNTTSAFTLKNNGAYLHVTLDCPLRAGDKVKTIITSKTAYVHYSASQTATMTIATSANSSSYQEQTIPAALVGKSDLYIYRGSGDCNVLYFEIIRPTYTVTAQTSTGTTTYGTVSAGASTLTQGSTTTITAVPADGYQVAGWAVSGTGASISPSGASNSTTTTLTMGSANATVTVTFEAIPSCAATADAGDDKATKTGKGVAMAATAATSGYTGTWSIKSGSPNTSTSQLSSTSAYNATFTPTTTGTYTLVWTVTDDSDGSCSATDEADVVVTAPSSDATFSSVTIGSETATISGSAGSYTAKIDRPHKGFSLTQDVTFTTNDANATVKLTNSSGEVVTSVDDHDFSSANLVLYVLAEDGSTSATYTLSITTYDKYLVYLTTSASPSENIYGTISDYAEDNNYKLSAWDVSTSLSAANMASRYDLVILAEAPGSSNTTAQAVGSAIGNVPVLSFKGFMFGKTNWPSGSGYNPGTGSSALKVITTKTPCHDIFDGLSLTGASKDITILSSDPASGKNGVQLISGVSASGWRSLVDKEISSTTYSALLEYVGTSGSNKALVIPISDNACGVISSATETIIGNAIDYLLDNSALYTINTTKTISAIHVEESDDSDITDNGDGTYSLESEDPIDEDDNAVTVTLSSSCASYSVDYSGLTDGYGDVTVTVTAESGATGTYILTVTAPVTCTDAELAYGTKAVAKTYGAAAFTNTLTNSHSVSVTYSSTNTSVATVESDGEVTIVGVGETTIKATLSGDATYCDDEVSYTLTVSKADLSVTATAGTATSVTHNSATLPFTMTGTTGVASVTLNIYLASDDSFVKSVTGVTAATSGSGEVTGLSAETEYYFTVTPIGDANHNNGSESSKSSTFTTEEAPTLTALVADELYQAADMANITFTGSDQHFTGLSSNTKFEVYGTLGSSDAFGKNENHSVTDDISEKSFTSAAYITPADNTSSTSDPTQGAIEIITPATSGVLYFYLNSSSSGLSLKQKGKSTSTSLSGASYKAMSVKASTHYFINGASSNRGLYGIKYVSTYSVSITTTNVTKESGDATAIKGKAYTATFTANDDYELPSDATVTIGGSPATKGTEYTWTESDGTATLTIGAAYVTGAISISVSGVALETHTITYNAMGGSVDPSSETVSTATLPTPTHPSSYTFLGWFKTDGTEITGTYHPTADITLYAKWQGDCEGGGDPIVWDFTTNDFLNGGSWSTSSGVTNSAYATDGETILYYVAGGSSDEWDSSNKQLKTQGTTQISSGASKKQITNKYFQFPTLSGNATVSVTYGTSNSTLTIYEATSTNIYGLDPIITLTSSSTTSDTYNFSSSKTYYMTMETAKVYFKNITVTPVIPCYTVTYDGNGATSGYTNDPVQYAKDADPVVKANGFERTGYEFVGWYTKASVDGTGTWYQPSATISNIASNMTLYAQWRVLISSDNTNFSGYTSVGSSDDVRVTNGATLTITSTRTIHDIIIDDGATLNVSTNSGTGITFTVNSLHLKGGLTSVGGSVYNMPRVYIDSKSTLVKDAENPIVNFDISVDTRNFYPIAVPFRVRVKDVDYANSFLAGYSNYGLTGQYVIKEYDGARRAEKGPDQKNNWKVVPLEDDEENDVYLEPGKGYILTAVSLPAYGGGVIRFPLEFTNAWTALGEQGTVSAVTKNVVAVTAHTGKATEGDKYANKGWNLLGVPFMSCYTTSDDMGTSVVMQGKFNFDDGTWDGEDTHRYVNVPLHDFSEYVQVDMEDEETPTVLRPGWCFFVQIGTTGSLTFLTADQAQSSTLPIYAPKRTTGMPTVKTGIVLSGNGASDKTTLLISDKYNGAEYEINADLEKMFGSGYTLATYSLSNDTRLAYNAMSRSDAQLAIPIGYRAPAEGLYTFSINPRYAESGAFSRVDLIDYEAGTLTNLLMSDYTFSTERTQNDTRFAINVVLAPQVTTDIESVNGEGLEVNGVRKVLINNELYIVVDGKMFDATGKTVKGGQK